MEEEEKEIPIGWECDRPDNIKKKKSRRTGHSWFKGGGEKVEIHCVARQHFKKGKARSDPGKREEINMKKVAAAP